MIETKLFLEETPLQRGGLDELLARSTRNSFDCFKTLLCLPGARLETSIRGLEGVITKRQSAFFNFLVPTADVANLDKDKLGQLIADFRSQSIPLCIELQETTPQDIHHFVQSLKPAANDPSTHIIYEAQSLLPLEPLPGAHFRLMQEESDVQAFLHVMQSVWPEYGKLVECFGEWVQHYGYGPKKAFQTAILRQNDKVVGIGSLFFGNGIVSPFNIAVLPSEQKNGYGQAIIKSLVNLGFEHGFKYFAATGSAVGMNLYRKAPIQELGKAYRYIF